MSTTTTHRPGPFRIFGWPKDKPLPRPSNIYPISPPPLSCLRIYIGACMDGVTDTLLEQALDNGIDPAMGGLCITIDINSWTPERKELIEQHIPIWVTYFVVHVIDQDMSKEVLEIEDRSHSPTRHYSSIQVPLDSITDAAAMGIVNLPSLRILHILPPLLVEPAKFLDHYEEFVDRISFILQDVSCTSLEEIALPLDFDTYQLQEYITTLRCSFPALRRIELLEPESFDLLVLRHEMFGAALTTRLENTIIKAFEFFSQLRNITLPLALATPSVLETLSRLPDIADGIRIRDNRTINASLYSLERNM